jgi:protein-S-isoprenylcysteine O-methyltransferase Ste14
MGRNWRMAVAPGEETELVTSGPFARVRHPIYALSILLMLCTLVVVPTLPLLAMAVVHVGLMVVKARNEERFLERLHGAAYADYCRRTGRFVPRLGGRS